MAATSKGTHALSNNKKNEQINDEIETNLNQNVVEEFEPNNNEDINRLRGYLGSQRDFSRGRKIVIKNIPPNLKNEDISKKLEKITEPDNIKDISINSLLKQAIVKLDNDLDVELASIVVNKWNNDNTDPNSMSAHILPYNNLLVIAHLPKSFTKDDFSNLVSKYSSVEKSTLMTFGESGVSMQYGIVWFTDSFERNRARDELDWKEINGRCLHVDMVDSCSDYESLYSRCLFVDNLPKTFKEAYRLREIFNCVASPVYCQIMMKDKESLGYGIIEYKEYWQARETWFKLQDYLLDGIIINITFCIPNKPAVSIFTRIMNKLDNKNKMKRSLLPDPVLSSPVTINNPLVKGLAKQNPELMKSFMQALQVLHTNHLKQVVSTPSSKPGLLGPVPSVNPVMNPNTQLGLLIFLATHMNNKYNQQQFTGPLATQLNILQKLGQQPSVSPNMAPPQIGDPLTAKANTVIQSLKAQVKGKINPPPLISTKESQAAFTQQLLQNTRDLNVNLLMNLGQIMTNIQNKKTESLMSKNIPPPSHTGMFATPQFPPPNMNTNNNNNRGPNYPSPAFSFVPNAHNNVQNPFTSTPKPLLSNYPLNSGNQHYNQTISDNRPNTSTLGDVNFNFKSKPMPLLGNTPQESTSMFGNLGQTSTSKPMSLFGDFPIQGKPPPLLQNTRNFNFSQNLSGNQTSSSGPVSSLFNTGPKSLLGNGMMDRKRPASEMTASRPLLGTAIQQKPVSLLGEPPRDIATTTNNNSGYQQQMSSIEFGRKGSYSSGLDQGHYDSGYWPGTPDGVNDNTFTDVPNNYYPDNYKNRDENIPSLLTYNQNNSSQMSKNTTNMYQSRSDGLTSASYQSKPKPLLDYNAGISSSNDGLLPTPSSTGGNRSYPTYPDNSATNSNTLIPSLMGLDKNRNVSSSYGSSQYDYNSVKQNGYPAPLMSGANNEYASGGIGSFYKDYGYGKDYNNSNYSSVTKLMRTPVAQKRSFSQLLPAPEPSPEGNYIGQHSQGIGGHYADSYSKRVKLDNRFH